jgi:hypothetical protein
MGLHIQNIWRTILSAMDNIVNFELYRQRTHSAQFMTMVEMKKDRRDPNVSIYRITGDREQDVQSEIDALTAEVESFGNGYGQFFGPIEIGGGRFGALGTVKVFP